VPLLDDAEHASDLLNGDAIDVEQSFDGDCNLRKVIRYHLQHLAHDLDVGDVVASPGDAVREILHVLRLLPHQGAKLTPNLPRVHLTHALDSNVDLLDHLPCRCYR
jgi:hypothetical protein